MGVKYPKTMGFLGGAVPNVAFGAYLGLSAYQAYKQKDPESLVTPAATVLGLGVGEKWLTPVINRGVKALGSKVLTGGVTALSKGVMPVLGLQILKEEVGPFIGDTIAERYPSTPKEGIQHNILNPKAISNRRKQSAYNLRNENAAKEMFDSFESEGRGRRNQTHEPINLDELREEWGK